MLIFKWLLLHPTGEGDGPSISVLCQNIRNHLLVAVCSRRLMLNTNHFRLVIPLPDLETLLPALHPLEVTELALTHRPTLLLQTFLACFTQLAHIRRISGGEISFRRDMLCNDIGYPSWEAKTSEIRRPSTSMVRAANISILQSTLQESSGKELADVVEERRNNYIIRTSCED